MKITNQQVWDMTIALATLIRENRPLPPKGKYWVQRRHTQLKSRFDLVNEKREALITTYDYEEPVMKTVKDEATGDDREVQETCVVKVKVKNEAGEETDVEEDKVVPKTVGFKSVPTSKLKDYEVKWKEIAEIEEDHPEINPIPFDLFGDQVSAGEFQMLGDLVGEPSA